MKAGETVGNAIDDPNAAASKVKDTGMYAASTVKDNGLYAASVAKDTGL